MSMMINGVPVSLPNDPRVSLLDLLREDVGLPGTKKGCDQGACGACTVLVDGVAKRSCITMVGDLGDSTVATIEALAEGKTGRALQKAWLDVDVVQCGYCQSGQLIQATALLEANAQPDDSAIDAAMAGNICRCGTYARIRAAIHSAAHA